MNASQEKETATPGADTRERLVQAGLVLFGRHGFDGVTTRALAEAAGVNLAAIPYHFGGKEGVYAAVAEHVVSTCGTEMLDVIAEVLPQGERPSTPLEATQRLKTLITGVIRVITRSPTRTLYGSFIVREQLQPGAAFEMLYERMFCHVHGATAELVGIIQGTSPDAPHIIMQAHACLGMALSFGANREVILRRLGMNDGYTPKLIEQICDTVARMTEQAVSGTTS